MMKINLISRDEKKRKLTFEITGAELSYLNTLRRYFTSEVPVLAVESLELKKNDSGLYDEIIAHRLGLTPFTNDFKSYNLPQDCKCKGKGCARCQLAFTLKAEGPCTVYASDVKTKDPKVKPVFPKMPITKLLEGQRIELEGLMTVGLGKEHTKWSPCTAYYRDIVDVKIEKQPENKEQIAEHCPTNVFDIKNDTLIAARPRDCILCGACQDLSNGKIKVTPSGTCLMTIESWGHLEPEEIVTEGINAYNKQLEEFAELVAKIK